MILRDTTYRIYSVTLSKETDCIRISKIYKFCFVLSFKNHSEKFSALIAHDSFIHSAYQSRNEGILSSTSSSASATLLSLFAPSSHGRPPLFVYVKHAHSFNGLDFDEPFMFVVDPNRCSGDRVLLPIAATACCSSISPQAGTPHPIELCRDNPKRAIIQVSLSCQARHPECCV